MLIFVSCGAPFNVSCKARNRQGIGHVCYPNKARTTKKSSWTSTAGPGFYCHVQSWDNLRNKICFCQMMPSAGSMAYSHLSSAGSKERGNCFQNTEPRRKPDPDLSTSALHIFMPDVATCQTHKCFYKDLLIKINLYTYFFPPVVKM